ncbi:rab-GTPase-TBC domain-domain-containing protein [Absidia repens]|uniref:Rab-GTPase-TBC domain-domain-containing protein n=1 Tax=Absidia repens TaxID=90262 RepID=A0A1X2IP79_9FUNG|nr:rab-GTPase-TBC domain-domain-containing protein [Absidia repens]
MYDQQKEQHGDKRNTFADFSTATHSILNTATSFSCTPRGLVWQTNSKSVSLHLETIYGQLCDDHSPYERIIQRDLTRTFPGIDMFKQENGPGQMALCRILVAYSLYDAQVGYCQGLAFLVGPLLLNMPEPQAFCVFVRIMKTYGMRSMFTLKMEGLQLRLYQFSCLLEEHIPDLANHLDKHSIHPAMYASQWFLTIFAYVFPMELVAKIYDMLFVEGATETIMRVAIAMLQKSEHVILLENEFEDLLDCMTTRKLCAPYSNDWSDVINDAMVLSNKITRQTLGQLEQRYQQQDQQEKHQTERALGNSRIGRFWRRRKSSKRTKMSAANTPSKKSYTTGGHGDDFIYSDNDTYLDTDTRNDATKCTATKEIPPPSSTATTAIVHTPIQELMEALDQLQKEHNRTIDELLETKMDKKDVENERDALKMTIMELEKRHHQTLPTMEHSVSGATLNNVYDGDGVDNDDDQQYQSPCDGEILASCGKSPSRIISCSSNSDMASISGHKKSLSFSSSATTLLNFAPPPPMKKVLSVETSSSLSSWSAPFDPQQSHRLQMTSNNHLFRIYSNDGDTGDDDDDVFSNTMTSYMEEEDMLRAELVRNKVHHFEAQQQCERLEQEVEDYQSRLDMMNEGQMALMDKLVRMTSEMEDLLQDKQRYDEKWLDLVQENSRLMVQLEEQNNKQQQQQQQQECRQQQQQQQSTSYLKAKIYHLETSLAATKVQLAEIELSTDHRHHSQEFQERSEDATCQQEGCIHAIEQPRSDGTDGDGNDANNDPLLDARTVGNGRIGRSVTLYGRMWHAISPRSQAIGSS